MSSSNSIVKQLLLLKNISGLGCNKINKLISRFSDVSQIFSLDIKQLQNLGLSEKQACQIINPDWGYSDKQLDLADKYNIKIISIYDNDYPKLLQQIYDPPIVLYTKGNIKLLNSNLLAVVGTRKPTIYGRQMAEHFSSEIFFYGYVVTSGFALGIDIISHLAALRQHQPTVVVLGTSIDCIYPSSHKKYVDPIIEHGGLIISENGFTTYPHPSCFPRRNRIISGLCQGVLVIEAARKSGSLITARCAMEQSREVFAIPGNINNQQSLGCLDLIAQGAKLTINMQNIVEELSGIKLDYKLSPMDLSKESPKHSDITQRLEQQDLLTSNKNIVHKLSKSQAALLEAMSSSVAEFDNIVNNSHLTAQQVMVDLLQLEIMGLVSNVHGGYVKC